VHSSGWGNPRHRQSDTLDPKRMAIAVVSDPADLMEMEAFGIRVEI
jgi:hypothetical protein